MFDDEKDKKILRDFRIDGMGYVIAQVDGGFQWEWDYGDGTDIHSDSFESEQAAINAALEDWDALGSMAEGDHGVGLREASAVFS